MKTVLILFVLIISSSYAVGETYKWEDGDAMYFTDNPESIPEKYREIAIEESREEIQTPKSEVNQPPPLKIKQMKYEHAYVSSNFANPAQQTPYPLKNTSAPKNIKEDFEPLSKTIAAVILFSAALSIAWIIILVDIIMSDFTTSSLKATWILLVLFVFPLGMLLYLLTGLGQKKRDFIFTDIMR